MFGWKRGFSNAELEVILWILGTSNDPRVAMLTTQARSVDSITRSNSSGVSRTSADYVRGAGPEIFVEVRSTPVDLPVESGGYATFWVEVATGGILRCLAVSSERPLPKNWRIAPTSFGQLETPLITLPEPNRYAAPALAAELELPERALTGILFPPPADPSKMKGIPQDLAKIYNIADGFRIGRIELMNIDALVELLDGQWNFAINDTDDQRFMMRKDGTIVRIDNDDLRPDKAAFQADDLKTWLTSLLK